MRFHVVTIFPEIFGSLLSTSLVGKAVEAGQVEVSFVDPRDFTHDRHRSTDDTPFGGGGGMVMKPEPVVEALEAIDALISERPAHRVLLTPQGAPLTQAVLGRLLDLGEVALVCGRYEGFDERIRAFVDEEISLGDFVLNGGEVAAMAVIDGVSRLVPGVLGNVTSVETESHGEGLLEYPQYTRPREFRGLEVPEILLNGDHERIRRWRRQQMLQRTRGRRPDLWRRFVPSDEDLALLREAGVDLSPLARRAYVALVHHPVHDREGQVITTAITNLDLHDIARSCRTYGLGGYFVVTPLSSQQELANRIADHWKTGFGAKHNPLRKKALSLLEVVPDVAQAVARVEQLEGQPPCLVGTTAAQRPGQVSRQELFERVGDAPLLLLLGTGWGLAPEVLSRADVVLAPLRGASDYNHLSVRSAAAILLDRLFGLRD
jgi:tRNA (guanine37-N1)-methyltransferase